MQREAIGLKDVVVGDGRPLFSFTGLALILSGGFAIFLAATGHFLPHDARFLGFSAEELCGYRDCRILRFMIHDRVAFGGTLIAAGSLYWWLAEFPLYRREAWAWWTLLISGIVGFASFLTYLGYGYLDTWHGFATLLLLPFFGGGLALSYVRLPQPKRLTVLLQPSEPLRWNTTYGMGRLALLGVAAGLIGAGLTIMTVGMSVIFVPQDLTFMQVVAADLDAINERLIPLIAHDRAGFGGGLATTGVALALCLWKARPSRNLWQVLAIASFAGFGCAIGVHFAVGYTDFIHLAPAYAGATVFLAGLFMTKARMFTNANR
jgi:hypothetical protein